jgi:hypothetical protein
VASTYTGERNTKEMQICIPPISGTLTTIPVFKGSRAVYALDHAATVIAWTINSFFSCKFRSTIHATNDSYLSQILVAYQVMLF